MNDPRTDWIDCAYDWEDAEESGFVGLVDKGLAYVCVDDDCDCASCQTCGLVFHARPGVSLGDIVAALERVV